MATGVGASAEVAVVRAPQATIPTTKTQTRAVPRSRIVARNSLYSTCSRGVIATTSHAPRSAPDKKNNGRRVGGAFWHNSWSGLRRGAQP